MFSCVYAQENVYVSHGDTDYLLALVEKRKTLEQQFYRHVFNCYNFSRFI